MSLWDHSPSASSAFNSRSFSSTGGGKEDSGGSAILVGRDCSKGSAIKRRKFTTWSGRGNSCSTVFTCSTRAIERGIRQRVTWQATSFRLPNVQHDSITFSFHCSEFSSNKNLWLCIVFILFSVHRKCKNRSNTPLILLACVKSGCLSAKKINREFTLSGMPEVLSFKLPQILFSESILFGLSDAYIEQTKFSTYNNFQARSLDSCPWDHTRARSNGSRGNKSETIFLEFQGSSTLVFLAVMRVHSLDFFLVKLSWSESRFLHVRVRNYWSCDRLFI